MWGGAIRLKTAMLFCLGFIGLFMFGGLTGMAVAVVPFDWQITDSYFIVGHFHGTLFGGTAFGIFAGLYYWFPKMFGRMLNERLGKLNFWTLAIGFLLTFTPMLIVGLMGMPRRDLHLLRQTWVGPDLNFVSTIGAYIIAFSIITFLVNVVYSLRRGEVAGPDPWDAWTLEWATSSPPSEHNFETRPVVGAGDLCGTRRIRSKPTI